MELQFLANKALFEQLTPAQFYLLGVYTLYSKKGKATITNEFAAEKAKVGMSTFKTLKKQLTDLKLIDSIKGKDTLSANITHIKTPQIRLVFDGQQPENTSDLNGKISTYFAKDFEREIHENLLSMYNDFRTKLNLSTYEISDKKGTDNALIYKFCSTIFKVFSKGNLYRDFNGFLQNVKLLCTANARYLRKTEIQTFPTFAQKFEREKVFILAETKAKQSGFYFFSEKAICNFPKEYKYGFYGSPAFKEFNESEYNEREITVNENEFYKRLETISQYDLITNFSELESIGISLDLEIYDILRGKFLGTDKEFSALCENSKSYYLPKKEQPLQPKEQPKEPVKNWQPVVIPNDLNGLQTAKEVQTEPQANENGEILVPQEICEKYKISPQTTVSYIQNILSNKYSQVPKIKEIGVSFASKFEKYGLKYDTEKESIALENIVSDFGKYRKSLNYLFLYFPHDKDFLKEMYKPSEFLAYFELLENKANEMLKACN